MKGTATCQKCGSKEIIADAKAIDRDESSQQEFTVATFRRPDALIFKQKHTSTVSAWVCAHCGYVELYADAPAEIRLPKV